MEDKIMRWQAHDIYFRQFLAAKLGLPIVGRLFFAFPAGSSTSLFAEFARRDLEIPAEFCFEGASAISQAFAAASAYRNDTVVAFPGAYNITTELAWNKPQTHFCGMGGPNQRGDYSEPEVVLYTDTAAVANTVTVSGYNCIFKNATIQNAGANAGNLSALNLTARGCYFENMSIQGTMATGQLDVVAAASLYIGAAAYYPEFRNCIIGQNVWGTRSGALSGVIRFTNTSSATCPQNVLFDHCTVLSASETVTTAMVALPANNALDRMAEFRDCTFHNFSVNDAIKLNQVIYDNCGTSHSILLTGACAAIGIDEWQDADGGNTRIGSTMPIVGLGGGLARNPTAVTGS
jgi:hypothetical protein